jgi:hypothetical protein
MHGPFVPTLVHQGATTAPSLIDQGTLVCNVRGWKFAQNADLNILWPRYWLVPLTSESLNEGDNSTKY